MKQKETISCSSLGDLDDVSRKILKKSEGHSILTFKGDLGAGKTTLIRSICRSLGTEDRVTSPTFAIVNEYLDGEERSIFHFDFYRIQKLEELEEIGVQEYFDSGNICLIEWPSRAGNSFQIAILQ